MNANQKKILEQLAQLKDNPDIEAIALFGSAARDQLKESSDIDAIVIVSESTEAKGHVLHPVKLGIKLDISFHTFSTFEKEMQKQADKVDRIPMIGESKVLFDKSGELTKLREKYLNSQPQLTDDYRQFCKFMITHNHQKVLNSQDDQIKILFLIDTNLEDTLKRHYLLQGHWKIADKRILEDLQSWDPQLQELTTSLISESNYGKKLKKWITLNEYIYQKNDITSVDDTSCSCEDCKKWLNLFK